MLKKIIVSVSFFIIILFLITPSIQAIQFEVVKDAIYEDCEHQIKNKDINNLRIVKFIEKMTKYPHPFLFYIVISILYFRYIRFIVFYFVSTEYIQNGFWPEIKIKHPILYLSAIISLFRLAIWYKFWYTLAETMGWNW